MNASEETPGSEDVQHQNRVALLLEERDKLTNEELRLKIEQLRLKWWQKPAQIVMATVSAIPVLLAVGTWIASQYYEYELVSLRELESKGRLLNAELSEGKAESLLSQATHQRQMLEAEQQRAGLASENAKLVRSNAELLEQRKAVLDELRAAANITTIPSARVIFEKGELPHVVAVSFQSPQFTDESLEATSGDLRKLPYLERLHLDSSGVTNGGFEHLWGMRLKSISLNAYRLSEQAGFQITDPGLMFLKDLPNLEELDLSYPSNFGQSDITNESLRIIREMASLRKLNLSETRVTDEGLKYLEKLSNLEELDLRSNRVTEDGVKTLQSKLPKCKILH